MTTFKQEDYDKAIQYFRAALKDKPNYWQAYQFLGESYYQSGNRTEALVAMQISLKLQPNNPELRKFVERVKDSSPWVASGPLDIREKLSVLSFMLSLITLGWTLYWAYWLRPRSIVSFLMNLSDKSAGGLVSSVSTDFTIFNSGNKPIQVAGYRLKYAEKVKWEEWNYFEPPYLLNAPDSKKVLSLSFTNPRPKIEGIEFGDGKLGKWNLSKRHLVVLNEAMDMVGKPKKELPDAILG